MQILFFVNSEYMYNNNNDLERHFCGISIYIFKNNLTFMKKAALHMITLIHCKARQVLLNLFSTNEGNVLEITFAAGATKINLKNLKT